MCMWKYFKMWRVLVIGDLEQAWYFNYERCLTPSCLFITYLTRFWYIGSSGPRSLSVCVSYSLSVVVYFKRRENAFIPNVS